MYTIYIILTKECESFFLWQLFYYYNIYIEDYYVIYN